MISAQETLNFIFTNGIGTATWPEMAWSIVGLTGMLVTSHTTREAWLDKRSIRRLRKEGSIVASRVAATIVAQQNFRNTANRLFIFVLFVLIGILAMLTAPGRPNVPPTLYQMVLSTSLLLMEINLTWGAIADSRDRAKLVVQARKQRITKREEPAIVGMEETVGGA